MVRGGVLLLLALCAGCVAGGRPAAPAAQLPLHHREIHADTVWRGRVLIDGAVKVFKGATLTILPGTEVAFVVRDQDRDGLGDGTLIVEGSLRAVGRSDAPIVFRSAAAQPGPGDWLELRIDFAREAHLQYCEIRDSAHALHAHFTRAVLEDSHIHHNLDGSRLGQGSFTLRRNLVEHNEGKGINFRNASVEITGNIIRHNGAGIFLFETDRALTIAGNNLYGNGQNLQLGDFFHADVALGENWWGSSEPDRVAATIHDRRADPTLGRVTVGIAPAWIEAAGPQRPARLRVSPGPETGGFVDAAPQAVGEKLLSASWDGRLRLHDPEGRLLWDFAANAEIDSAPLAGGGRIYAQSWGCEVFALEADSGERLWSFTYPPSPHDDHRQGGVALAGSLLLVPAWNGTLYALDAATGVLHWQYATPGPLRTTPLVDGEQIYLAGGDGVLRALDRAGRLLWERAGTAPLLAPLALLPAGPLSLARDGALSAYTRTGELLWQRRLEEPCFYAGPRLAGGELFVATAAGSLWKFDAASGRLIWRKTGLGPVYATPLTVAERLLVGDNDGFLTLVDATSGRILDRSQLGAPIQGGPSPLGARIVLGCRDRRLYFVEVQSNEAGR